MSALNKNISEGYNIKALKVGETDDKSKYFEKKKINDECNCIKMKKPLISTNFIRKD